MLAGAAALVVPRRVLGGRGHVAPSDRLVIAGVGVGGVGRSYLKGCESQSIAVLCDVDLRMRRRRSPLTPVPCGIRTTA